MQHGCDICRAAKQALVVNAANEQLETFSIARQSTKLIGDLLDRLSEDIHQAQLVRYHPQWSKDAAVLAKALVALLTETRKFEESAAGEAKEYTFNEKVDALLLWCDALSVKQQETLMGRLLKRLKLSLANE